MSYFTDRVARGLCGDCGKVLDRKGSICKKCCRRMRNELLHRAKVTRKKRVHNLMKDGQWRTIAEIRMRVPGSDYQLRRTLRRLHAKSRERPDSPHEISEYMISTTSGKCLRQQSR